MIKLAFSNIIEPIEDTVWMKEVEDGCIVEADEACPHGSSHAMFSWEEDVDNE